MPIRRTKKPCDRCGQPHSNNVAHKRGSCKGATKDKKCDNCGKLTDELYECPDCGKRVCAERCCAGRHTRCFDCENADTKGVPSE